MPFESCLRLRNDVCSFRLLVPFAFVVGMLRFTDNPAMMWAAMRVVFDIRNQMQPTPWRILTRDELVAEFIEADATADMVLGHISLAASDFMKLAETDRTMETFLADVDKRIMDINPIVQPVAKQQVKSLLASLNGDISKLRETVCTITMLLNSMSHPSSNLFGGGVTGDKHHCPHARVCENA
jgi:hypothetical protein